MEGADIDPLRLRSSVPAAQEGGEGSSELLKDHGQLCTTWLSSTTDKGPQKRSFPSHVNAVSRRI